MQLRIHIGLHNTGTSTSFQKACSLVRDQLRSDGIIYPMSNQFSNNGINHTHFVRTLSSKGASAAIGFLREAIDQFADCRTILLSSEEFSNIFGTVDLREQSENFVTESSPAYLRALDICA